MRTGQGGPLADPAETFYFCPLLDPRAAQSNPNIFIPEVLPAWGPLKRYTYTIGITTYKELANAARWVFEYMQSYPGGPSC
jgi:hypothetical protein